MQMLINAIFPPQCILCSEPTDVPFNLCARCFEGYHPIDGASCFKCGAPVLVSDSQTSVCEACFETPPPWNKGASVALYAGAMRRFVLGLKHGDRQDFLRFAAPRLAEKAQGFQLHEPVFVPIPLHWFRLIKRRSNQAAGLARHTAKALAADYSPDALVRIKATPKMENVAAVKRFELQQNAIALNPKRKSDVRDRNVILVDDVMTTGATLTAATRAIEQAAPKSISVLTLARAVDDSYIPLYRKQQRY